MERKQSRYPIQMAVFLSMYYVANTMFQSYMSLFYTSIAFTSAQIGIINACIAPVSIFAQPLWGTRADRSRDKRRVVILLAVCAGVIVCAYRLTRSFPLLILLAGAFSVFYTSVQPIGDTIILQDLETKRRPFGPIRLIASLSFAVASLLFGRVLDKGLQGMVPVFTGCLCLLTAVSAFTLPRTPGGQSAEQHVSFGALLKQKKLVHLLLFVIPLLTCLGYFYTFFSPHFVSLPGGNSSLLGAAYFISATSEFPFLIMSDKLFDKYGAGKLMCVSAALLTIRFTILATTHTVLMALLSQLCHGGCFIVITVCMSKYIARTVPSELLASGQMLLAMATFGIPRTCGNLLGGLLADAIGRQNVFFIAAGICLVTLCVFAPYYLRRTPMNGLNENE